LSLDNALFQHFVADRKIDEELGKTTRFQYDSDHLKEVTKICDFQQMSIANHGLVQNVMHVRPTQTTPLMKPA
jgi:hypothetical protein